MQDPQTLRRLAGRCRKLVMGSTPPAVVNQLRLWVAELAGAADATEHAAAVRESAARKRTLRITRRTNALRRRMRAPHFR